MRDGVPAPSGGDQPWIMRCERWIGKIMTMGTTNRHRQAVTTSTKQFVVSASPYFAGFACNGAQEVVVERLRFIAERTDHSPVACDHDKIGNAVRRRHIAAQIVARQEDSAGLIDGDPRRAG